MAGVVLVHAVGGGDLGLQFGRPLEGAVDFVGDTSVEAAKRRPLRKVFAGLAENGTVVDAIALIATANNEGSGLDKPYVVHARELAARLCGVDGLFGWRFARESVRVVEVERPTMGDCVEPVARALVQLRPRECLITFGTGSFALCAGSLLAALEVDVPATLLPVDDVPAAYRLTDLIDSAGRLRDWALRHRSWDELAELDPAGSGLWRLLAARQRADVSTAEAMLATDEMPPGLTVGKLRKLTEVWPTIQAAFFERIARGEAVDQSLLRAWYAEELARRMKADAAELPERTHREIADLVRKLTDGKPGRDGGPGPASLIRSVRENLPSAIDGRCIAMLRDQPLEDLYRSASSHQAHLDEPLTGPLPTTVVEQAKTWENSDIVRHLATTRGMTSWPVLGSGDVLVLVSLRVPAPDRDEADWKAQEGLRCVIRWAAMHRDRLPRRGRVRLRLLASAESAEWAEACATWARTWLTNVGGEVAVVAPLPTDAGAMPEIRRRILASLESAGAPSGLTGSDSLRDVDEILLVVNPGKAVINLGMITAGLDWSLRAAATLRVAELSRKRAIEPVINEGGRVLRQLGPDPLLARLAAAAVRRLDLRTAWQLLGHGSAALDGPRTAVDRLHRDLYGGPPPSAHPHERFALAVQRLALVARVLADEPWSACYTAVETLRPGLFAWDDRANSPLGAGQVAPNALSGQALLWPWVRNRSKALQDLERLRDRSPYAHLLDKKRREKEELQKQPEQRRRPARWWTDPPRNIPALLAKATDDLRALAGIDAGQDVAMFRRYERVRAELSRLAATGADRKGSDGPDGSPSEVG